MKQTTIYVAASLVVLLLLLQPPSVRSSQAHVEFNQWIQRLREILRWRPKRACTGYMCAYHHMGTSAAYQSKHKSLMRFLQSCAMDPLCSPGKRRKRSMESLSRSEQLDKNTFTLKKIFPRVFELLKKNRKESSMRTGSE